MLTAGGRLELRMTVAELKKALDAFPDTARVRGICFPSKAAPILEFDIRYVYDFDEPLECWLSNTEWDDGAS